MKQRFTKRTRLVSALLTLAMVFTFLPFSAFAATDSYGPVYISDLTFPDETFREYILKQFDENNNSTLSPDERYKVTEINVNNKNITSLKGIEFFPNLKKLYCANNNLTSLDVSQNTALEHLDCDNNQLTSLQLDDCTNLGTYNCDGNKYSVQVYESTRILDPGTLPGNFDISRVRNMKGATKNADGTMTVNPGEGKVLYEYRLFRDYYDHYYVIFTLNVEFIPEGSIVINASTFPNETFREYISTQFDNGDGILDTAEREAVTEIKVSGGYNGEKITNLKGIEFFPNLLYLDCSENNLSSLDVSYNTELMMLLCYQNKLNSLDVTRNPALITLNCNHNSLTSLDVSQNTALTNLKCFTNNLTSLNVSKNDNLETLHCYDNQLTELDVTQFIALQELKCDNNNLTSLNVSKNTKLVTLTCDHNSLTSLDVSQNPALELLDCVHNSLTSLDVSKNTALKSLDCSRNSLASLDVSKNPALTSLFCSQNSLASLDVSKNEILKQLICSENQLTSLDLSPTVVELLYADGNQIDINVETTPRTFDLSTLPGKFDVTKATNWNGGDVDGNTLKVKPGVTQVTYTYDCGKGFSRDFALNVKVVPDGSGGGTIPPEAGKYQLTVTDGVATVNGSTGAVLNVKPGDTVTLTADTTKFPENEEFGWWEITPYGSVSNTLTGQYQRTATFTMPNENVSARAMSKSAGVSTGGDDGGGGGGAAILLVGGAAVAGLVGYGVYSYVSEQQLKALLPEGVAMPENRAQTALLLWNTAGRPEPSEAPAFKDVADPDTAKAAQWCVEHGLMDQKLGGRFAPDNSDPAYKTLNAYQQLVG